MATESHSAMHPRPRRRPRAASSQAATQRPAAGLGGPHQRRRSSKRPVRRRHQATLIFQNRQGEATDIDMAFETLEHRLLPRASVVAMAETGWNSKMFGAIRKRLRREVPPRVRRASRDPKQPLQRDDGGRASRHRESRLRALRLATS